ncbi:LOW QUALITY PROTEIN: palmitoyltransferase ZDHHC12 [Trichechus inunguis]
MAPWAFISPGVVVRTGHTVLTWGITLVLFLHDTELRQWEEQGELLLPLTFLLLVLGSLLLYLAVSLMDPGYMNVQPQPQEELKEEQMAMVPQATPLRRCRYCLVLQPLRARHCHECHRCVRRYDHHCPWMENCVGERNHPLFVAYLALQLVVLLWALYLAWAPLRPWERAGKQATCVHKVYTKPGLHWLKGAPSSEASAPSQMACSPGSPELSRGREGGVLLHPSSGSPILSCRSGLWFFQPWGLWLRSSGLLFATFLLLSLFSSVAGLLLASHLYLVASNTTTWEFISSHRIAYLRQRSSNPFDRGLIRNLAHFFCGWPSGSWETLWAEEEEDSSQAV